MAEGHSKEGYRNRNYNGIVAPIREITDLIKQRFLRVIFDGRLLAVNHENKEVCTFNRNQSINQSMLYIYTTNKDYVSYGNVMIEKTG